MAITLRPLTTFDSRRTRKMSNDCLSIWRPRRLGGAIILLLSCVAFGLSSTVGAERLHHGDHSGKDGGDRDGVSPARLSTFISLATSYLVRVSHTADQDPDYPGKFTYIAYVGEELESDFAANPQEDYNLLRHNGALYSLGLSYAREENDDVLDAMKRSVDFIKKFAIGPVPDKTNLLAAWESKKFMDTKHDTAKLGGAGLALIALVSLEQIVPGSTKIEYMRKIAEFIKYLQHDDGSFTCKYVPDRGGRQDFVSLYYPGEAALGLVYLASIEDDESHKQKWLDVATNAILYLENIRELQKLDDVEPDHWALLATSKLLPLLDEDRKEYELVYQHGVKVVKSMLSEYTKDELKEHQGCMTLDRRTCPTSTRLEGLIAALNFVRPEERFIGPGEEYVENLRERMLRDIPKGIQFLLDAQETDESFNMHGAVPVVYPRHGHGDSSKEVRVDYVQHSMSAVIAYEELLLSEARKKTTKHKLLRRVKLVKTAVSEQGSWSSTVLVVLIIIAAAVAIAMLRKPKKKLGKKH